MRKTKIICTIGPACDDMATLTKLAEAGMNVARLNFSHGTHEEHADRIAKIKRLRKRTGLPIAILLDTKGPEYRIGTFEKGKIHINTGDRFTFWAEEKPGTDEGVTVSYKRLAEELQVGDTILVSNGVLSFKVTGFAGADVETVCEFGGDLSDRKSMAFPGRVLKQPYLSEKDKEDIEFGISMGVDFIACSFVSCRQDLEDIRDFLKQNDADGIELIAKIENRSGVDHIDEICEACSGVMVARGDLGVEVPFEELPKIQKELIKSCSIKGKRVITATEMLESMINSPRPTRAETSDVANAVYDGTSAVMLSGETAAGKYPVLAVQSMAKICEYAESTIDYAAKYRTNQFTIKNTMDAISHATVAMAIDIDAKAIAVSSISGTSVRMVSRFRPPMDIIGLCTNEMIRRKLALSWGVTPVLCERLEQPEEIFHNAENKAVEILNLKSGDLVVATGGEPGKIGSTNLIKIETVD